MNPRFLALAAAAWLAAGAPAIADPTPAPSASQILPSIPGLPGGLQNSPIVQSILNSIGGLVQTTNGNAAHGKVTYFRRFDLQLETAPNVYRQVHLHQGTEINPRGTTLAPGMVIDVSGTPQSDHSLNADVITAH